MKVCRPGFYKKFQCIGSRCQDTCCALWEIEVDDFSAERYEKDSGPLAEDFRKYLVRNEEENYFRLTKEKRCPFLNEENLCRMILTMGEDYICDICREHPRFYHWFGDYTEVGRGLCCEEAGRLLFSESDPLSFEVLSDETEADEEKEEELPEEDYWVQLLLRARTGVIGMLQDRNLPLEVRAERLADFGRGAQPYLDEEDIEGMETYLESWLSECHEGKACGWGLLPEIGPLEEMVAFYEELESLDETWPKKMGQIKGMLPELQMRLPEFMAELRASGREMDYEHLLVYFVFRYFMEAIYDSNLLSPLGFAVSSLRMILLLDLESWNARGSYTLEDRIRIAKWYSKEIEYCPDNMERLAEQLEENGLWQ